MEESEEKKLQDLEGELITTLRRLHSPNLRTLYSREVIQSEIKRYTDMLNEILAKKHKWQEVSLELPCT